MNRAYPIIAKSLAVILGVTSALLLMVTASSKFLVGFGWDLYRERGLLIGGVVVLALVLGAAMVISKLRVWIEFYRLREAGKPVPPEVFNKSFVRAYGFPAAAAFGALNLALAGSLLLSFDLVVRGGYGYASILHIMAPSMVYFALAAMVVFYLLKLIYRPVLLDLAEDRPEILAGEFDRTCRFTVGPLLFLRFSVNWRMPIRAKLLLSMLIVCLLGTLFLYVGYREIALSRDFDAVSLPGRERLAAFFSVLIALQVGVCLAAAYALSYLAARDIADPVREITRASRAVIGGRHGERALVVTEDELGDVAAAVNRMAGELVAGLEDKLDRLRAMMGSAERGADMLAGVSRGILESVAELSQAASVQRRDAVDAAESAQRLGTTSEEVFAAARQIQDLADRALGSCNQGQVAVQDMVNTMDRLQNEIHQASDRARGLIADARKIGTVVELIDEISDQINLVSLNAALEAAGAGAAGRRFNAVAEEVTRLAQHTLNSTGQVSRMIGEVIRNAETVGGLSESGSRAVDQSVTSMEDVGVFLVVLLEQVENVSKQVLEISGSTQTQTAEAAGLREKLEEAGSAAAKVDENIKRIQAALRDMDAIAEELRGKVSEGVL